MNNFLVFSGTATQYLTEKICKSLGVPQGQINITRFADERAADASRYRRRWWR